jgi:hypothetical protein
MYCGILSRVMKFTDRPGDWAELASYQEIGHA